MLHSSKQYRIKYRRNCFFFFFAGDFKIQGDICVNGNIIDLKYMRQISGFVFQDDLFVPSLTVLEHLHFAVIIYLSYYFFREFKAIEIDNFLVVTYYLTRSTENLRRKLLFYL